MNRALKNFLYLAAYLFGVTVTTACGSLPPNENRIPSYAMSSSEGTLLGQLVSSSTPKIAGKTINASGFRILGQSESAYGSRIALIDGAQRTLDLQYYSIHYDTTTENLLSRLRLAASRGVHVRVLLDDFNAVGENAKVLELAYEPNIELRLFNPVLGSRVTQTFRIAGSIFDFKRIQRRMHNKALIADNAMAVAGGRNLGNEYFGQGEKSNFLDVDLLIAGPLVKQLSTSFDKYWNDDFSYPLKNIVSPSDAKRLETAAKRFASNIQATNELQLNSPTAGTESLLADKNIAPITEPTLVNRVNIAAVPGSENTTEEIINGKLDLIWSPAVFFADSPTKISEENDEDAIVIDGLLKLLKLSHTQVLITSPYFVPGERMMAVFSSLRAKGIVIKVLTNSLASNDAPLAHVGYSRYRKRLLAEGIELYELPAAGQTSRRFLGSTPNSRSSLHSKVIIIDSKILIVGSMNLDLRSALQNTELAFIIKNPYLARTMEAVFEKTAQSSYQVTLFDNKLMWKKSKDTGTNSSDVIYYVEPGASIPLKILLKMFGPLAPEELL